MSWIDSTLLETCLPEYRVRRRIATGGQRSVFLAEHRGKPVAMKVMRPETFDENRFKAEAELLRSIDSEFVEALHDVGRFTHEGKVCWYLVTEWIDGRNLDELREERKRFSEADVLGIASDVAEGLREIHANVRAHRDIKPSNIMIREDTRRAVIVDFGVIKLRDGKPITETGEPVGTTHFMSPEQLRSAKDVDARTDLFSLGIVLYILSTGHYPFPGESPREQRDAVKRTEPLPPSFYNPSLSPGTEGLILRLLRKKPFERPRNCRRLLVELEAQRLRVGQSVPSPFPNPHFFVQHGRTFGLLSDVLEELSPADGVILSASYDPNPAFRTEAFRQSFARIWDPQTFRQQVERITKKFEKLQYHSKGLVPVTPGYFDDPKVRRQYLEAVVNEQLERKVSIVVAPYFKCSPPPDDWLERNLQFAEETVKCLVDQESDLPVVGGMFLLARDLINQQDRENLLFLITQSPVSGFYLWVDPGTPGHAPISNEDTLKALAHMVSVLSKNGYRVILANGDDSALILLASGAVAYGSGATNRLRKPSWQALMRSKTEEWGRPGTRVVRRYYSPQLMNWLRIEELAQMKKHGLLDRVPCRCPFCRNLLQGDLSEAGFDQTIANQHYLYRAAMAVRDLRAVPPADRISFLQKRIEEGQKVYDAIEKAGITLSADSSGTHLARWKAVLSSLQSPA